MPAIPVLAGTACNSYSVSYGGGIQAPSQQAEQGFALHVHVRRFAAGLVDLAFVSGEGLQTRPIHPCAALLVLSQHAAA